MTMREFTEPVFDVFVRQQSDGSYRIVGTFQTKTHSKDMTVYVEGLFATVALPATLFARDNPG